MTPAPDAIDPRPRSSLWFVGALPPPLNGQSNCNRAMLGQLTAREAAIRLHDIGGTGATKVRGVGRAMLAMLFAARRGDRAYLSVPGQNGAWLFVPLVLILRLRGIVHYVHHHSFRSINRGPVRAMQALVAAGGRCQRHILLSGDMRCRFVGLYLKDDGDCAVSLSNASLFGPWVECGDRPARPVTLGHMSVLTREKGVAYLLDLFADLIARGHDWRLVIAGPCADPVLASELAAAVAAHPDRIDYRGTVDGIGKERFFADIDLFVLPTTLIDEAEPLVMLEAFGSGVDVVANDTGCIRDRIRTPDHLMTLDRAADRALVEARVADSMDDWAATRRACADHAKGIKALADVEAAAFFSGLLGPAAIFAMDGTPVT